MLYKAYLLPWQESKVIANAARISRGPWRIIAATDATGLYCSQRFHGIWPKVHFPLEVIAGILNGPVANAILSASARRRDNLVSDLDNLPVPRLSERQMEGIAKLVMEYRAARIAWLDGRDVSRSEERCFMLAAVLDSTLLSAYELPNWIEQELIRYFHGTERPGPVAPPIRSLWQARGELVNQKFERGLSTSEELQLSYLTLQIHAAKESLYRPALQFLTEARDTLLTRSGGDTLEE
jgi:hypothetical protein